MALGILAVVVDEHELVAQALLHDGARHGKPNAPTPPRPRGFCSMRPRLTTSLAHRRGPHKLHFWSETLAYPWRRRTGNFWLLRGSRVIYARPERVL